MFRYKQFLVLLFLLSSLSLLSLGSTFAQSESSAFVATYSQAIDGSSATIELTIHDYLYQEGELEIPGLETYAIPGAPALPFYSRLIPVPYLAETDAKIVTKSAEIQLSGELHPTPELSISLEATSLEEGKPYFQPDPAIYTQDRFYPDNNIHLSEIVSYQGEQFLRLSVYPARYNPVQKQLAIITSLRIEVRFTPTTTPIRSIDAAEANETLFGLPLASNNTNTRLPVGKTAYKITIDQDGLYQINYDQMQTAGMNMATIDPRTIEMMHNGENIAYQFVGNPADGWQQGETIRWYGWQFDGSNLDRHYVTNNVFWLWAGGSATNVVQMSNPVGLTNVNTYRARFLFEENNRFNSGYTSDWKNFPFEPDSFIWLSVTTSGTTVVSQTIPFTLTSPVMTGAPAIITSDWQSYRNQNHQFQTSLAGIATPLWNNYGAYGFQQVLTLSPSLLVNGQNQLIAQNGATGASNIYLQRISAEFDRYLHATNDQLIFDITQSGSLNLLVSGFTQNTPIVWNITNRLTPQQITIPAADVTTVGSANYQLRLGSQQTTAQKFITIAPTALRSPLQIERYQVNSLNPTGGADWVAVTHATFRTQADRLAAHRADTQISGLRPYVVDVQDVINQFGYGLPTPEAIRHYISYARANWNTKPRYLLLFGDASANPRAFGDPTAVDRDFVPTYLLYADRFVGQIPTDTPYALLEGGDKQLDIAVGRLTATTSADAQAIVDKIIRYEINLLSTPDYIRNFYYANDNTDSAGNFCLNTTKNIALLDDGFNVTNNCLPDSPTSADLTAMRENILQAVNQSGLSILNWRGHGSITDWGGGVLNKNHAPLFTNADKPIVIVTADCLDGYFTWPANTSISETFLRKAGGGTAAHWSSAGLGYLFEYSILDNAFYEGLQKKGLTAIGDAVTYAKLAYNTLGYYDGMSFAMNLQGDPAMQLMRSKLSIAVTPPKQQLSVTETVEYVISITNDGNYPSLPNVEVLLPLALEMVSLNSAEWNYTARATNVVFQLTNGINQGETRQLRFTARAITGTQDYLPIDFTLLSNNAELTTNDNTATALVKIISGATAVQLQKNELSASAPASFWLIVGMFVTLSFITLSRRDLLHRPDSLR